MNNIETIITQAKSGDTNSLEYIWQDVRGITQKWLNKTHLIGWEREDLEQEAYLVLVESIHRWDPQAGMTFFGYYKVRLSVWRQLTNKKRTEHPAMAEDVALITDGYAHSQSSIEEQVLITLGYQNLLRQLDTLSPLEKDLILAHYMHGKHLKDIATKHGLKRTTASSRIQRALRKLKITHIEI